MGHPLLHIHRVRASIFFFANSRRSKTIMTFVVIGLIGAGYNFFKFYMSDRDRKIFATIIGLQILSNIAQVEVWEGNLGSQSWRTWVGQLTLQLLTPGNCTTSCRYTMLLCCRISYYLYEATAVSGRRNRRQRYLVITVPGLTSGFSCSDC